MALVPCPSIACGRRIRVGLGTAENREEASGLRALAETCARHRSPGAACAAFDLLQQVKADTPVDIEIAAALAEA